MKVAVIGMGVIGKAMARALTPANCDVLVTWDIASDRAYPFAEINRCDFAIICVGTPQGPGGRADLTQLLSALLALPFGTPALIRSTVPPAEAESLTFTRRTAYWPEFMHERPGGAWSETTDVPFTILGGSPDDCAFFAPLIQKIKPGPVYECSAAEAMMIKYVANLHWATRVTFVNEMASIARKVGADWENVRGGWLQDERVGSSYTSMDGFEPGYGGRCWPKDIAALISASTRAGYEPQFLEAIERANERYRQQ